MIGLSAAPSFRKASCPNIELISISCAAPPRRAASACMSLNGTNWSSRTAIRVAGVRTASASMWCRSIDSLSARNDSARYCCT